MTWNIESKSGVAWVEMNSSKANIMNDTFYNDFNEAFDKLDSKYKNLSVVLTGHGRIFSAGLDFSQCFPMFKKGNRDELSTWFTKLKGMFLRLYQFERPIIAALNGHAFAGGMILALCCDFRIGVTDGAKFSINEVPVGVPMPPSFAELVRNILGPYSAEECILTGKIYEHDDALRLGLIHHAVDIHNMREVALLQAKSIREDCYTAYAFSKKTLRSASLERIQNVTPQMDEEFLHVVCGEDCIRAHNRALEQLKA